MQRELSGPRRSAAPRTGLRAPARSSEIDWDGEEKRLVEYSHGLLHIDLLAPWRREAFETEFSRFRVSYVGEKMLELQWDRADTFTVVLFKPGEWEETL